WSNWFAGTFHQLLCVPWVVISMYLDVSFSLRERRDAIGVPGSTGVSWLILVTRNWTSKMGGPYLPMSARRDHWPRGVSLSCLGASNAAASVCAVNFKGGGAYGEQSVTGGG